MKCRLHRFLDSLDNSAQLPGANNLYPGARDLYPGADDLYLGACPHLLGACDL
jgi:hypothetical protein